MGTNYFAHIIPSYKRKKKLHDAIDVDDFTLIKRLTDETYNNLEFDNCTEKVIGGVVHLGKHSYGWKFLWNPNIFVIRNGHMEDVNGTRKYVRDTDKAIYTYPLTKKGLRDFIFRDDVRVYDECDNEQDKEWFWGMATTDNGGWDTDGYEKEIGKSCYPVTGDLVDMLKREGYKFTSPSCCDFYSDGLRFAGFTDFS